MYKTNFTFINSIIWWIFFVFLSACSVAPRLNPEKIRLWSHELGGEYPREKPVIAHYISGDYELLYLAARHTNNFEDTTLKLVKKLFEKFQFKVLIIESIPHASGESPQWFIESAKKGRTENFIRGGESALSAIYAHEKNIPFFAGEPSHQEIYKGLKEKGYSDEDVIGFYTVRQIPQWVREKEEKINLFERKIPPYVSNHCQTLKIASCPKREDILKWYQSKLGQDLVVEVSNEETAPYSDGNLFTQKLSSNVGQIRDKFTLNIIQQMLQKYKKVAVVYGAGHFLTLRKSFDASLGEPKFIEQ